MDFQLAEFDAGTARPPDDVRRRVYDAVRAAWMHRVREVPAASIASGHAASPQASTSLVRSFPTVVRAPYTHSIQATGIVQHQGFIEDDLRLPQQPNGTPSEADLSTGVVGHSMLWFHNSGTFDFGDNASLDVTRISLVGAWFQIGSAAPSVGAHLTCGAQTGAEVVGNVHIGGSGSAWLRVLVGLDIFASDTQANNAPMAPLMSTIETPIDRQVTSIDGTLRLNVPSGQTSAVALAPTGLSRGTWILVVAGAVTRFVASVHHADLIIGAVNTWTVDSIGGFL